MDRPVIETSGLTKFYGARRGIEQVDLVVPPGEVFGFLGPNGAGKTTTIRILMDLIRPTAGSARIFGLDARAHSREIRRRVGYLPGELNLYEDLTGEEIVRFFGSLRGNVDRSMVEQLAHRFDLDLDAKIKTLSHGNQRKIGIVLAFMHRPELLVLDEPTTGLDPLMQHRFEQLVRETAAGGATVFLSSHILPEVEAVCDRVGMIRAGSLVAVEGIAELKGKAVRSVLIRFAEPVPEAAFSGLGGVQDLIVADRTVRCTVAGSLEALIKAAARYRVVDVISEQPSLEDIFLTFYEEAGDAA